MKTSGTLSHCSRNLILMTLILISGKVFAQPDYDFSNYVQESGSGNAAAPQKGDVYRYLNVKPGFDALVEVTDFQGGVTLNSFDNSTTGFVEAFQPFLNVPAHSRGYVEFEITFVDAGTSDIAVMGEVPVTPIDVDGYPYSGGMLYEYDELDLGPGSYVNYGMVGYELQINQYGDWFTGENISGITYNGVDTTARQVMFTVVNTGIATLTLRVGADNQSDQDVIRYRSDYFKKFAYTSALLPVYANGLVSFKGVKKENDITLMWELTNLKEYRSVIVERATNGGNFEPIAQLTPSYDNMGKATGNYTDHPMLKGTVLYRLKMISNEGAPVYSNILMFKMNGVAGLFKVFPTVVDDATTLQLTSAQKQIITVRVTDYSGRIVLNKQFVAQNGENSISVDGMSRFARGNYVISVYSANEVHSQKMIKL